MLSARYHLFVRATEGAYTCLSEAGPHVSLARREQCPECGAFFEFGACKSCGSLYLSGSVHADGALTSLASDPRQSGPGFSWTRPAVTDEDDETLEEPPGKLIRKTPCCAPHAAALGWSTHYLRPGGLRRTRLCRRRLNTPKDTISGCLACGGRGTAMVRGFESGGCGVSRTVHCAVPVTAARA